MKPLSLSEVQAQVPEFFMYRGWMSRQLRDRGRYEVFPQAPVAQYSIKVDEAKLLDLPVGSLAEKRRVFLHVDDVPWIYAETVMPEQTLRALPNLRSLGKIPLGDFLKQESAERGELYFFTCDASDECFQTITSSMRCESEKLLLRCSVFTFLSGEKIIITEVLLQKNYK